MRRWEGRHQKVGGVDGVHLTQSVKGGERKEEILELPREMEFGEKCIKHILSSFELYFCYALSCFLFIKKLQ